MCKVILVISISLSQAEQNEWAAILVAPLLPYELK